MPNDDSKKPGAGKPGAVENLLGEDLKWLLWDGKCGAPHMRSDYSQLAEILPVHPLRNPLSRVCHLGIHREATRFLRRLTDPDSDGM